MGGSGGAGGAMLAKAMQDTSKVSGARSEPRTDRGEGREGRASREREREPRLAETGPRKRTANGESKPEGGNLFG
jgi:hypothetical protein